MAEVHETKLVATPPVELWEKIGDFYGLDQWWTGIPPMEADGDIRRIGSGDNAVVEQLVEEGDLSYTYRIVQGPLPVENYTATLRVTADGDGSLVEWSARFDPVGVAEDQAVAIVSGVFSAGLANL